MTETTAATPNETRDAKLEIIMGREALDKLADATVLVLGCGGVGSNCCEALARGGIGHFCNSGQGHHRAQQYQSPGHRLSQHHRQAQGRCYGSHDPRYQSCRHRYQTYRIPAERQHR